MSIPCAWLLTPLGADLHPELDPLPRTILQWARFWTQLRNNARWFYIFCKELQSGREVERTSTILMHSSQAYFHTINESHFFLGNAESNRYNEEVFKNSLKFAILGQVRRLMRQKDGHLVEILFSAEFPTGGFWGGSQGSLLPEEAAVDQGTISNYLFGRGVMHLAMYDIAIFRTGF